MDSIRQALVITERELQDQLRDWRILFPIGFLALVIPFLVNFAIHQFLGFFSAITVSQDRLLPFLMLIVGFFPISISLVMALESFVGEKERSSIEPLLNSPLKDWQLYLGKILAALLLPLAASYLSTGIYLGGLAINHMPMPPFGLTLQILLLTTVQSLVMVSAAVAVSTQVTTVRAANLLASFIILPVAMLIPGESLLIFFGSNWVIWISVFGLLVFAALLVRLGLAHFRREEMLGREYDALNLRWALTTFKNALVGDARNPLDWYLRIVPMELRRMTTPVLLVTAVAVIVAVLGGMQTRAFDIPISEVGFDDMNGKLLRLEQDWPLFASGPLIQVWWQNTRALLIGALAGMLSFGIFGMLPLLTTLGTAGYMTALIGRHGLPVFTFLVGFVLPHGIFEIPAAILASAASLKMGATLADPQTGKTLGETWLESSANIVKILLGVVVPVLFVAAAIEVWVTPRLALWLFR